MLYYLLHLVPPQGLEPVFLRLKVVCFTVKALEASLVLPLGFEPRALRLKAGNSIHWVTRATIKYVVSFDFLYFKVAHVCTKCNTYEATMIFATFIVFPFVVFFYIFSKIVILVADWRVNFFVSKYICGWPQGELNPPFPSWKPSVLAIKLWGHNGWKFLITQILPETAFSCTH